MSFKSLNTWSVLILVLMEDTLRAYKTIAMSLGVARS